MILVLGVYLVNGRDEVRARESRVLRGKLRGVRRRIVVGDVGVDE